VELAYYCPHCDKNVSELEVVELDTAEV
jgi:hypothetical protein